MIKTSSARGLLLLSMTVFGTLGLFVRHIPLPPGELALYRALLAALLLGLYLVSSGQGLPLRSLGRSLPLLLLSGATLGINWILLFQAYRYTTVSVATLSYYFAPVLVTLASPLLFRERLGPRQIGCFLGATLGLVLITGLGDRSGPSATGIAYGLGAALFYAAVVLLNKAIRDVAGIPRTFLQFLAAILVLGPYVALTEGCHLDSLDGLAWGCLLLVGLVHTGLNYCLYFTALKDLPGQTAALLSYLDPLVAVLVSVLLLGESMTLPQVLGGGLILGSTLYNELPHRKETL